MFMDKIPDLPSLEAIARSRELTKEEVSMAIRLLKAGAEDLPDKTIRLDCIPVQRINSIL
jgi:hypothetical protein